jgi:ABC-type multidrug transport system permease subunit
MEENAKLLESLLERATEYGKTSFELVKLKALDKTSCVISSFASSSVIFILIASFLLFFSLGLSFWLGEILGEVCFGFFVVAVFYIIIGIVLNFFMHKWLKRIFTNYIIKQLLK